MKLFTVEEIAKLVNGEVEGSCKEKITAPEQIEKAKEGNITLIGSSKYIKLWKNSSASVAIINKTIKVEAIEGKALIKVENPDLAMASVLEAFLPDTPYFETDIHATAVIDDSVTIGKNCKIGANSYIGKNVVLGDNVIIYPNVSIFDDTIIGNQTIIWSGTVIRERTEIGKACILHNNVSIGADGFGYIPSEIGLTKVPHIGNVVIGNHVEIGANSCIDKGKFSSTILGDGCKIDNLVQIAHDTIIGKKCLIASQTAIAGCTVIEDEVIIWGQVGIVSGVTVGAKAILLAKSGVSKDLEGGKTYYGVPCEEVRKKYREMAAIKKLPEIIKKVNNIG